MGEQYIDLFAAGGYALSARVHAALAQGSLAWLFYLLAAAGMLVALVQSALEQRPELWLRHLAAVALASVLTLQPLRFDLAPLTYGAPGRIETVFGTTTGAAPHLTYWVERAGARATEALRSLTHQRPTLAIPGVDAQVREMAANASLLDDAQLQANLDIWRRRVAPALLAQHPDLATRLQGAGLEADFILPAPADAAFSGARAARARQVRALLDAAGVDLTALVRDLDAPSRQIASDAGARPWQSTGSGVSVQPCIRSIVVAPDAADPAGTTAWTDALEHAHRLAQRMHDALPGACEVRIVRTAAQLHETLGNALLPVAAHAIINSPQRAAIVGSQCQRAGDDRCASAMSALVDASARLHVPPADPYNQRGWTTWLEQPLATSLLMVTAALLNVLSALVISVLPFAMGVAKSLAIVVSVVGAWMLLWPGRAGLALHWMVVPVAFVSLWSLLFQLWADIEPALTQIGAAVSDSRYGSRSAIEAMSIAISLGYMGLPSLAAAILYGQTGRALASASTRVEHSLMTAWHARAALLAQGKRWLTSSPLARRWNARAYQAVGLGTLRGAPAGGRGRKTTASRARSTGGAGASPGTRTRRTASSASGATSTASSASGPGVPASAADAVATPRRSRSRQGTLFDDP